LFAQRRKVRKEIQILFQEKTNASWVSGQGRAFALRPWRVLRETAFSRVTVWRDGAGMHEGIAARR
jgi:hypothetical protein